MIKESNSFLTLNRLILLLAITTAVLTSVNSFYASYEVQKERLIMHTIEVNQAYANKLSSTTEVFLESVQQQLSFSSAYLSEHFEDPDVLNDEVIRLRFQTNSFNSVVISDASGVVQAISPEALPLLGMKLSSTGTNESLRAKAPIITDPFVSFIDNLLVFISVPIFGSNDEYLGFIGGTIYLRETSSLNMILGQHYYKNDSHTYVIDKNKTILYHPDANSVGLKVRNNDGVDEILENEEGGLVLNSNNETMLVGYSVVPTSGWVIITQRPLHSALEPLKSIITKIMIQTIPISFLGLICIWLFSRAISSPLQLLARQAKSMDSPKTDNKIESINAWYFESQSLKEAIRTGLKLLHNQIGQLQQAADTDPLTGAHNRRAFQLKLNSLVMLNKRFSLLSLDIDHFKHINDTYGHNVGDEVLQELTQIMTRFCRSDDMVIRTGGEEFIFLAYDMTQEDAWSLAEILRITVSERKFNEVGYITVSIGIATWENSNVSLDQTLIAVDEALYQAKEQGRNQCVKAII